MVRQMFACAQVQRTAWAGQEGRKGGRGRGRVALNANDKFMYKLQRAKVPLTNPYKRTECVCVCACVECNGTTRRGAWAYAL